MDADDEPEHEAPSPSAVGIVGGGIVGLAVARELTRRHPGLEAVVFEKEPEVAGHQTGHNSGVVHAGIYYPPGSLKAELCAEGRTLLKDYCSDRDLPFDECGKLVVAVDDSEVERLDALEQRARANAVPLLRRLGPEGIGEIEPHAAGVAALHSPRTAITDFARVARSLADDVISAGGRVLTSTAVEAIDPTPWGVSVRTSRARHRLQHLVVCAGLQADRVSRGVDGCPGPRIVPFRGEYLVVAPPKRALVRGLIYPVPDPRYPFLGVHFTRRVGGVVDVGPNAVLALDREGYARFDVDLGDVRDLVTWPGFWRMARRHWRTGLREIRGSLSIRAYMRAASAYVPEIGPEDVERGPSGVRAQAVDRDGSLVDDFRINCLDAITTVRNAPSPAATSSLAIARHVADRIRLA